MMSYKNKSLNNGLIWEGVLIKKVSDPRIKL